MKTKIAFILVVLINFVGFAQDPESFFPHNVGDRWEYIELFGSNEWAHTRTTIIRDSVGTDESHNLFYDSYQDYPQFRIDSALNVFDRPQSPRWNYLYYKLDADTGTVWENPQSAELRWAWVAKVESAYVFSRLTPIKVYRYGPDYPDSADYSGLLEHWLASGIGLVFSGHENGQSYIQGCIIAGDTFGIVTSVEDIETALPSEFKLKQNYPNPFNPSTTIEFDLPNEVEVTVHIYDILGRQVNVLYEGKLSAGNHKIKWNASGIASGIYFCRVHANKSVQTIKMLLSK